MYGVLLRGIVGFVQDVSHPSYARRLRSYGGLVGFLLVLALPWRNAMIGAVVALGGYLLGLALGAFIDALRERPGDLRPSAWGKVGAVVAVALGAVGLVAWFTPLVGLPLTAAGVLAGRAARHTTSRGAALFGWGLSLATLAVSAVNSYLGMWLALLE